MNTQTISLSAWSEDNNRYETLVDFKNQTTTPNIGDEIYYDGIFYNVFKRHISYTKVNEDWTNTTLVIFLKKQ